MKALVRFFLNYYTLFLSPHVSSIKQQKRIIDSMSEPQNDFERVYFNYLCNNYGKKKVLLLFVLNLFSTFLIPFILLIYFANNLKYMFHDSKVCDAIIISAGNRSGEKYSINNIIPQELYCLYERIEIIEMDVFPTIFAGVLTIDALKFWWTFFCQHPFSGLLNFRCFFTIMGINQLILKYSPKAIVISRAEFNNMSSVISFFCETNGIEFINFMHGEALTNIQHAFVRFSKFYIWDEHYIKIFTWERCPVDQFVVYTPEIYSVVEECPKPIYYLTYIFTGDERTGKDANAEEVKNILIKLVDCGLKCKVRAHPRWSDFTYLTEVFMNTNIVVEDPKKVNGKDSILRSEKIAGTYSTMLSEAYHMKKDVVIDDITNPSLINELQEKMYIMLIKKHELLSEIVQKLDKIEKTIN